MKTAKSHFLKFCAAFLLLLAANTGASAAIVYVTPTGAGLKNGTNWANALDGNTVANVYYTKLRQAIYNAPAGTEFWIAKGTYRPGATAAISDTIGYAFEMKNPVKLYGGFAGNESVKESRNYIANQTILL